MTEGGAGYKHWASSQGACPEKGGRFQYLAEEQSLAYTSFSPLPYQLPTDTLPQVGGQTWAYLTAISPILSGQRVLPPTSLTGQVGLEALLTRGLSCRRKKEGSLGSSALFSSHHDLALKLSKQL